MYTEILAGIIVWAIIAIVVMIVCSMILEGVGSLTSSTSRTPPHLRGEEPKILTAEEAAEIEANKWWWQK